MPREKVTITLTESTLKLLDYMCEEMGIPKSYVITHAINTFAAEKGYIKKLKEGEGNVK